MLGLAVHRLSLVATNGSYSTVVLHRLLTEVASPVSQQGSRACRLQELQVAGFGVRAQRLWCTGLVALRHADSQPLNPREGLK